MYRDTVTAGGRVQRSSTQIPVPCPYAEPARKHVCLTELLNCQLWWSSPGRFILHCYQPVGRLSLIVPISNHTLHC